MSAANLDPIVERLLTLKETADLLRCCEKHVYNLSRAGKLPAVKVGQRRLYDPADVRAFIERSKEGSVS